MKCAACGYDPDKVPCPHCKGVGQIPQRHTFPPDLLVCIHCNGKGLTGKPGEPFYLVSILGMEAGINLYGCPKCDTVKVWR